MLLEFTPILFYRCLVICYTFIIVLFRVIPVHPNLLAVHSSMDIYAVVSMIVIMGDQLRA